MISTMLDHLPPRYSYGSLADPGYVPTKSYSQAEAALRHLQYKARTLHRATLRFKADGGPP